MSSAERNSPAAAYPWGQARAILARSFYNQLKRHRYTPDQILGLATEIITLITTELKSGEFDRAMPATGGELSRRS